MFKCHCRIVQLGQKKMGKGNKNENILALL
jgi:hypothetical protein